MTTYTPEQLKEILHLHSKWLRDEEGGQRANLTDANLRYANLSDADLTRANLTYANLSGANLTDANLRYANLSDADLTRANLTYANLSDADLTRANLRYANLSDADLTRANLTYANLTRANLTRANLTDIRSILGAVGNMAEIKSIQADTWPVTYTATHMQIGCQLHPLSDWWAFDDEQIGSMDRKALEWWVKAKPMLRAWIEAYPATGAAQ